MGYMIQEVININKCLESKNLNLWDFIKENEILSKFSKKNGEKCEMTEEKLRKSRRERFVKYREQRVAGAVRAIRLCENMANRNSYEYTDQEADVILRALSDAITSARNAFKKKEKKTKYF